MILTLVITKDYIDPENMRMLQEQNVAQDIYVVSAAPINIKNNIVVKVNQNLPLGFRMGKSINIALEKFSLDKYSHILKIDGDVKLYPNTLDKLLALGKPFVGVGNCLLIDMQLFLKLFKGKWGDCPAEDTFMLSLAFAVGVVDWYMFSPIEGYEHNFKPYSDRELYRFGEYERSLGYPLLYALYYTLLCRKIIYLVGWLNSSYKKAWFADLLRRRVIVKSVLG
jgi:hypothetical protein